MSDRLFKREVALTMIRPKDNSFFSLQPLKNAVIIRNLRVSFNVEKNLQKEPNTAEIKVYNLNDQTRLELNTKPIVIRLDAGYDDDLKRVCSGDLTWSENTRTDTGWVSTFQIGDGARAYKHGRFNRSFKSGTSKKDILEQAAGAMGLKVPKNVGEAKEFGEKLVSGEAFKGPSKESLDKIIKPTGHNWSIQNGSLRIRKSNEADTVEVFDINATTGMVGTPEIAAPDKPKGKPTITVKVLLHPNINPGNIIRITSENIKGLHIVKSIRHEGDTHDRAWYSTMEAHAI